MKKLIILSSLFLFLSCSNDDEQIEPVIELENFVIGEWRMIEFYENDVPNYNGCLGNHYDQFKEDNSLQSTLFQGGSSISLVYCPEYLEGNWTWKSLGNQQFEVQLSNNPAEVYTMYMEDENLVKEYPDGISKGVYEPINLD